MTSERGNASVALMGGAAMVMVMILALGDLGAFMVARARAQTAADAAALAAAAETVPSMGGSPVSVARLYSETNGATLVSCDCRHGTFAAEVSVRVPLRLKVLGAFGIDGVSAAARAEVDASGLRRV